MLKLKSMFKIRKFVTCAQYYFRHLADINRDDDDGFGDDSHERKKVDIFIFHVTEHSMGN